MFKKTSKLFSLENDNVNKIELKNEKEKKKKRF